MKTVTYKGYEALVAYDDEAKLFHGEVMHLRDVITFQSKSNAELEQALADSVEDYILFCRAHQKPSS